MANVVKSIIVSNGLVQAGAVAGTVDAADITPTGVGADTYGDSSHYPIITVNAAGQVTAASESAALPSFSAFGSSLVGAADATAAGVILGLATGAYAATGSSGHTLPYLDTTPTWSVGQTTELTATGGVFVTVYSTSAATPQFIGRRARGTKGSESVVLIGDALLTVGGGGWDGTQLTGSRGYFQVLADGTWSSGSTPTSVSFFVTDTSNVARRGFYISNGARVGMGANAGVSTPAATLEVRSLSTTLAALYARAAASTGASQAVAEVQNDAGTNIFRVVNGGTRTGNAEADNGNSGTAKTVDWNNGNLQKITLTGNCTLTFTAPAGPTELAFRLIQDATGTRTVTWPASVKWPNATAPVLTITAGAVDLIYLTYNGTNYYGRSSLNY